MAILVSLSHFLLTKLSNFIVYGDPGFYNSNMYGDIFGFLHFTSFLRMDVSAGK